MTTQLHLLPHMALPDPYELATFKGADGTTLRYAIFRSHEASPKGTVVLLQGRNESIEKYLETIADFTARGLWVATFDWRGQAGSDRLLPRARRGHVRRFSDYESDLQIFLEKIVLPDTRMPFFLVAHSTGALVALAQAPLLSNRIERMVLLAPFVGLGGQALRERTIGWLAAAMTWSGLGTAPLMRDRGPRDFTGNLLTTDTTRFTAQADLISAYPHLALGPPSARWLYETFKAIRRVTSREHLRQIRVPTILLAPTADQLVPYAAVERLAANFRACQLIPIPGARHELLQEADIYRLQAMAAIEAFIPGSTVDDLAVLADHEQLEVE